MGKSTLILPYTAHEQSPNHKIESLLLQTYCTIATREKKDDVHLDDKLSFLSAVNPTGLLASPENASDTKPLVPGVGRVIAVVKKDFAYRDPHPFPILACEKIKMGFSLVETLFFVLTFWTALRSRSGWPDTGTSKRLGPRSLLGLSSPKAGDSNSFVRNKKRYIHSS